MDQAMELIVDLQQELEERDWLEYEVENLRKELEDARSEVNWLHSELHGAELEAARARRTCKRIHIEGRNFMNGKEITFYKCSECDELMGGTGSYCPHCGAKVVE